MGIGDAGSVFRTACDREDMVDLRDNFWEISKYSRKRIRIWKILTSPRKCAHIPIRLYHICLDNPRVRYPSNLCIVFRKYGRIPDLLCIFRRIEVSLRYPVESNGSGQNVRT